MSISKRYLFLFLLLIVFSLTACSGGNGAVAILPSPSAPAPTETLPPPTETPLPLAALVNGEPIFLSDFQAELERYKVAQTALGNQLDEREARRVVLDDLIAQTLLAQGAAEAGFVLEEATLQARIQTLSSQIGGPEALRAWMQTHGYTEESFRVALRRAIAAAWMRDKIISTVPQTARQVHIRQILLYNETVAQNYYRQLQAGADFDELAIRVDPITRGDIGWFPRNYLPSKEVEEAAFNLEIGGVSEIIQSEAGFHILKLLEVQEDRPLSPDALLTLQNRALADWLAQRRQQSNIEIRLE
ncbi:MAG: SurA N-terminal domain-containing protein [Anaerolineales bacterium]|nr:SurA N-terminal domain-containing protein [Anaerolineales bacterium]MCX7755246.1 SurA N-terminal domain-containing protein [Anaerolineales bacterium]MDW8278911.1 SurA N-terminal domain-containing protein [Anaerolineales bacterium]